MSNHLGNVLVTISDKKIGVDANSDGIIDYYTADVVTANDYYPGGMTMPGRKFSSSSSKYRYGFNGKENDKDAGEGIQDYGLRIYDGRLGRFLSVDPLSNQFPWNSVYCYAEGDPVNYIDLDGGEKPSVKAQAVPVAIRPRIEPVHSEAPPLAFQQARQRAMSMSPILTPEQKKAADLAAMTKRSQSNNATLKQGGYLGSDEYKIVKARYDLYGQYLPGVSDIDDGLTFIGNIKNGNYKAAAFTALFFLPGGDFLKPLKNLKGAGKFGGTACIDYAGDFMSKYSKKIEDAGGTVKKMEIDMKGGWIGVGVGAESKQLSETGLHQFVEVTDKSGAVKIFDNAHPDGILKSDYLKSVAGDNGKQIMEGQKLYEKYAKEIK